jgi:hypothetical protein
MLGRGTWGRCDGRTALRRTCNSTALGWGPDTGTIRLTVINGFGYVIAVVRVVAFFPKGFRIIIFVYCFLKKSSRHFRSRIIKVYQILFSGSWLWSIFWDPDEDINLRDSWTLSSLVWDDFTWTPNRFCIYVSIISTSKEKEDVTVVIILVVKGSYDGPRNVCYPNRGYLRSFIYLTVIFLPRFEYPWHQVQESSGMSSH